MANKSAQWSLNMHQIECCNCNHGCGCQFAGYPDNGDCETMIGFQVIKGHFEDILLDNIKFVLAASWPGAIHEGNGKCVLFVDNSASNEQSQAITSVISGKEGGMPFEALATTFNDFEGPFREDIKMLIAGRESSFSINTILGVKQKPLINPLNREVQNVHICYPDGGFFWNDGEIGTTDELWINYHSFQFKYPEKFAAAAVVNWSNQ